VISAEVTGTLLKTATQKCRTYHSGDDESDAATYIDTELPVDDMKNMTELTPVTSKM